MDSKLGHKRGTQNHSDQVKNTIRRNGTYYYRRRIPGDLIRAAAFGFKNNTSTPQDTIRYSLHTKDPKEARRRMAIEDAKSEEEFERIRQQMQVEENEEFIRRRNSKANKTRKLSSISAPERRDIIFCLFVRLEQNTRESQGRDPKQLTADKRQETLENLGTDLAALEGNNPELMPVNWDLALKRLLDERGIEIDDTSSNAYTEMRELIQRAHVENTWRSFEYVKGNSHRENDVLFKGWDASSTPPATAQPSSPSIAKVCSTYLEANEASLTTATIYKQKQLCELVKEFFGESTPIGTITVEKAREFVSFLPKIPVNSSKRYKSLSLNAASAAEAKKKNPKFISSKTQKNNFEGAKSLFGFACDLDWLESNPFKKKALTNMLPKVKSTPPPPPTTDDLNLLFSSPRYLSERNKDDRGNARFWVPILCLFHGVRTNEACQLLVEDVQEQDGIHFIHIRERDEDGNLVKQLKTSSSLRKVPIHKEVVKMGFLDFVKAQQTSGDKHLFTALKKDKKGSMGNSISKWFKGVKDSTFTHIPPIRGAKGLHSLRHAFTRACRDAGVEQLIIRALGGWSDDGSSSETGYGDGYSLKTLKEAIDKVQYTDVDLTNLF